MNHKVRIRLLKDNPSYCRMGQTPTLPSKIETFEDGILQSYVYSSLQQSTIAIIKIGSKLSEVFLKDIEVLYYE